MRFSTRVIVLLTAIVFSHVVYSQTNRVPYNNQELFLNGANLAWVNFAGDAGTGSPDTTTFGQIMLSIHNAGGNSMRWWLHVNGTVTPAFDSSGHVTGPGAFTISDMRKILDLAWQREIGINICLWSFDMLSATNSATVINRNTLLLNDTSYTHAYINKCLIPMIDSLKSHPAILSWEIFNEPEGMSNEFGWSGVNHVPMSTIQRFVNLCAGAIHRADPGALVTSGSWSFEALSDVTPAAALKKSGSSLSQLSLAEKESISRQFNRKYRASMKTDEVMSYLDHLATLANKNYYSNSQLIGAGGDTSGTLDFYWCTTIRPRHRFQRLRSIIRQVSGDLTSLSSLQNLPWKAERATRPAFRRLIYLTRYTNWGMPTPFHGHGPTRRTLLPPTSLRELIQYGSIIRQTLKSVASASTGRP